MLPRAKEKEKVDGGDDETSAIKNRERKEKAIFKIYGVSLHYAREAGSMMTRNFSSRA